MRRFSYSANAVEKRGQTLTETKKAVFIIWEHLISRDGKWKVETDAKGKKVNELCCGRWITLRCCRLSSGRGGPSTSASEFLQVGCPRRTKCKCRKTAWTGGKPGKAQRSGSRRMQPNGKRKSVESSVLTLLDSGRTPFPFRDRSYLFGWKSNERVNGNSEVTSSVDLAEAFARDFVCKPQKYSPVLESYLQLLKIYKDFSHPLLAFAEGWVGHVRIMR